MKKQIILLLLLFSLFLNGYFIVKLYWMSLYDEDDFNCVDMSYFLAPLFRHLCFDTKVVYGGNDDTAHCWLSLNGVYFDATSLWFNSEDEYPRVDFVDQYPWGYFDELGVDRKN